MYNALSIAEHVIKRCNSKNKAISNLKLQKILYFIQAEFLVTKNAPCFFEIIEAWDFGPVVPEVYHKYKIFGSANIPAPADLMTYDVITDNDKKLMNDIIDNCVQYSASTLTEITQNQTPWIKAYKNNCDNVITNENIKKFFS